MRSVSLALICATTVAAAASSALALPSGMTFGNVDGGTIALDDWAGQPVLVVNTASMCGFAGQFTELQALYDQYRAQGLVVLAVPSDDFHQELGSDAEVADYCEMTFGIDMPMTTITPVRGTDAHPLYQWLAATEGFSPSWNFNKVLIGGDGSVLGTWGTLASPAAGEIPAAIEDALGL